MKIIDITQEVAGSKVYPGDTAPKLERVKSILGGDGCNVTDFSMCAHNGTHVDAPCHFVDGGKGIDSIELNKLIGKARVTSLDKLDIVLKDQIKKIIFKDCEGFTKEQAEALANASAELIGISGQSVGNADIHRILLGCEIVLLEGLDLCGVDDGDYTLIAAPIKLGGADGAPARVLLIEE